MSRRSGAGAKRRLIHCGFRGEQGKISEEIEALQAELASILGGSGAAPAAKRNSTKKAAAGEEKPKRPYNRKAPGKTKRTMSPEGLAAIIAAQKKRWAKKNA